MIKASFLRSANRLLAKQGDKAFGSVHPSVFLSVCAPHD